MTEHHRLHPDEGAQVGDKGLKKDAIGFIDGLVIGIASTAPAYSLAAVIAIVVVGVGVQAPAVMLVGVRPDVPDRLGLLLHEPRRSGLRHVVLLGHPRDGPEPRLGRRLGDLHHRHHRDRFAGRTWARYYTFDLFGLDGLRDSKTAVTIFAIIIIAVMTAVCVLGTELSATSSAS